MLYIYRLVTHIILFEIYFRVSISSFYVITTLLSITIKMQAAVEKVSTTTKYY